jgi:lipoate-protein ligase A
MTSEVWRFIESGSLPGAENMAMDEAMLEAHALGQTPPTLRVYGWEPPAVSLGRFQQARSSVEAEACRALGIDIVRRPTGGRAILHTAEEVTFSLVISSRRLGTTGVMDAYRALAPGIVQALRCLGLEARLVERTTAAPAVAAQDPACFAAKARCDLMLGSAKLVGSAQVQRQGVILQQNSLPLQHRLELWAEVFRRSGQPPEAIGLWEAAGRAVPPREVTDALREGFASAFGVVLQDSVLTANELALAREVAAAIPTS